MNMKPLEPPESQDIPCSHWTTTGSLDAGRCGLGLHGGHPSHGTCLLRCDRFTGDQNVRQQYVQLLISHVEQVTGAKPDEGLGDTVARWIKILSRGRVKPWRGCKCENRRQLLNWIWPYRKKRPRRLNDLA